MRKIDDNFADQCVDIINAGGRAPDILKSLLAAEAAYGELLLNKNMSSDYSLNQLLCEIVDGGEIVERLMTLHKAHEMDEASVNAAASCNSLDCAL